MTELAKEQEPGATTSEVLSNDDAPAVTGVGACHPATTHGHDTANWTSFAVAAATVAGYIAVESGPSTAPMTLMATPGRGFEPGGGSRACAPADIEPRQPMTELANLQATRAAHPGSWHLQPTATTRTPHERYRPGRPVFAAVRTHCSLSCWLPRR
jgi:hypothetical protein